ncbi:hypothetical protein LSH36_266g03000 [Paralvinella palmiformis]|uniref:Uncharacterized protein n=1 Tax=Paralvinella palmiformis TaxID=53620 RepID=A0AAD9JJU9_9ANNE|nr:hypothetical protein LSH36_266g03000 [Paralvinella palmiformis]
MDGRPVLKQSTIYEEDVPVIVRRRGCMLRVQVTSIVEDTDGEWQNSSCLHQNSDCGQPGSPGPPPMSSSPAPSRKLREDLSCMGLSRSLRLLHRTLSEDVRHRRRDSMPSTPVDQLSQLSTSHIGLSTSHLSMSHGHGESNLLKMKSSGLGHSAPNLSASMAGHDVIYNSGSGVSMEMTSVRKLEEGPINYYPVEDVSGDWW